MISLFSYVVDHDNGVAPNPYGRFCTLAKCKFRRLGGRSNIVELAKKGDWVVGTGGVKNTSAGHGKLIYAMRVDDKLTLAEYYADKRFQGRVDNTPDGANRTDKFVLISKNKNRYYFGRKAIAIPRQYLFIEKKGSGFKSKCFKEEFIKDFLGWLTHNHKPRKYADPCNKRRNCKSIIRRNRQKSQKDCIRIITKQVFQPTSDCGKPDVSHALGMS